MKDAEQSPKNDPPKSFSGKVLETAAGVFFLVAVLAVLTGIGGMLLASARYVWVVVFAAGVAGALFGGMLSLIEESAVPTGAWQDASRAAGLLVTRAFMLVAAVAVAAGMPFFILKIAGYIGAYHTESFGARPVAVTISGSCDTSRSGPLAAGDDPVTCDDVTWTADGRSVSGELRGTFNELISGVDKDGHPTQVDTARAYARGNTAYTPKKAHQRKPGSTARLKHLTMWAWAGLPLTVAGAMVGVSLRWSPEAPKEP
ncbi:hypothetical protein [Spirillospora sp. CA-128828]|uniref:hypothetical protein n=1 Tax=Spirillospora sp. CA-128828 TaxID=3240033 RepID=UPI003D925569